MLDRITDRDQPAATILLSGQTPAGQPYEAAIRVSELDQLADVAALRPGRSATLGPLRVTILSATTGSR